jgi:hypothetical protein
MYLNVDMLLLYPTGLDLEVFAMKRIQGGWLLKWRMVHKLNRKVAFTGDCFKFRQVCLCLI